jgi:protein involved in sex pheromone biosynthesis
MTHRDTVLTALSDVLIDNDIDQSAEEVAAAIRAEQYSLPMCRAIYELSNKSALTSAGFIACAVGAPERVIENMKDRYERNRYQ